LGHIVRVSAPRFVLSVTCGAAFYVAWMAIFLATAPYHARSPLVRGALWVLGPVVTGVGYTTGAAVFMRLRRLGPIPFGRLLGFPLLGCAVGAAVVSPCGPMLIVFGMCFMGSMAVLLFELLELRRPVDATGLAPRRSSGDDDDATDISMV
jgi:hypothetical protein